MALTLTQTGTGRMWSSTRRRESGGQEDSASARAPALAAASAPESPSAGTQGAGRAWSAGRLTLTQTAPAVTQSPQSDPQDRLRQLEQQKIELTAGLDLNGAAQLDREIDTLREQLGLTLPQQTGRTLSGMAQAVPAGLLGMAGSMSNMAATLYQAGQAGRQARSQETLEEYRAELELAQRRAEAARASGDPWSIQAQENLLQTAQARYDAMRAVVDRDIQGQAVQAGYALSDQLSAQSAQRVEQAKQGVLLPGRILIDAAASTIQSVADGVITKSIFPIPMGSFALRSFGAGAQQARQDGADMQGQLLYGGLSAAKEIFTEKLFNLTLPFSAAYGGGSMDDAVEKAIRSAVDRFAQTETGRRALGGGLTLLAGAAGEGLEEFIGDWLEWQLPRVYGAQPETAGQTLENSLYDFLVGAASGMMGGMMTPDVWSYDTGTQGTQEAAPAGRELASAEPPAAPAARPSPLFKGGLEDAGSRAETLWRAAESLGRTGAETLTRFYDGESDTAEYFGGFAAWYQAGLSGLAPEKVSSPHAQAVNGPTQQAAWLAGQADAQRSLEEQRRRAGQARTAAESGLVYDEYVQQALPRETAVRLDEVSRALGVSVRFVPQVHGGQANAQISGSQVLVEQGNKNPVQFLLGHEWTHRVQELAPDAYREFRQLAAEDAGFQADLADIQAAYDSQGRSITQEALLDEAAANYAGRLMEDGALLDEFIARNRGSRTLLEKLRDAIRALINRLTGAEKRRAQSAEGKLSAALDAAAERSRALEAQSEENAAREGGGERYTIKTLEDGRKYVQADRQVIFGSDPTAWGEQVEDYINGKIRQGKNVQLVAEDGEVLTLTADTAGKIASPYTARGTTLSEDTYYTKVNAGVHIDELAQVSESQGKTKADIGARHGDFASGGWQYRTAYFQDFDGKYYRLSISVAQGPDGNVVYNIGDIQERSFPTITGSSAKSGALKSGKASSTGSIAQPGGDVKGRTGPAEDGGQSPPGFAGSPFQKGPLETAGDGASAENAGEVRYSLKVFEDGTRFVDVDTDQHRFADLTTAQMQAEAKKIILERFRGKVIGTDYTAFVNKTTAEHYTHPANRRMDETQKRDKMQASPELDNLLAASTFRENVPDDGRHPVATGGLDKLETMFRVNGRLYQAEITVLVTDHGRVFYDMTKFNDITGREIGQTQSAAETSDDAVNNSVAQPGEDVKGRAGPAGDGGQSPPGFAGSPFQKGPLETAGDGASAENAGEVRYSLKVFEDGTRFVDVDTDQAQFDGLNETEMRHLAAQIIKSKFAGHVIGTEHPVFVNGRTASEYAHPSRNFESDLKKAKMRASTELDNLIDAGTNFRTEPDGRDGHIHPDMTGDFQYFDTIFKVGGEYYTGIINIMPTKRGLLLKDITKIRNITQDICSSYGPSPKSAFLRDASMGSIAQPGGDVKGRTGPAGGRGDGENPLPPGEARRPSPLFKGGLETAGDGASAENAGEVRYSIKQYEGKDLSQDADVYTYDFLTALPDMTVTALPDVDAVRSGDGKVDARTVVDLGMKNARAAGTQRDGKVFVRNSYTGKQLQITGESIRHGLNGTLSRLLTDARLGAVIGDVVRNAVPINALRNKAEGVTGTYAMAGYAADSAGREFVAILTVEQRTGRIVDLETYDMLHAVSGRQKRSERVDTKSQGLYPSTNASAVSIADFLEAVKSTHQSILSEDVLEHLGETRNPSGFYTGQAKFSLKGSEVTREMDELRQESLQLQDWVEKRVGTPWSRDSWTLPDAERMARRLGRDFDSRADAKKLAGELWELGEAITGKEGSWERVLTQAMDIAGELVDRAVIVNDEMYRQYAGLRAYLRKTQLHVPRSMWAELEHLGGYSELRKRYFGRLNLSSVQGTGIDQAYKALSEQFPEFFDEKRTANAADQLEELTEVLDSLTPVYENPFDADRTAARSHVAYHIVAELSQWNKVGQAQENARRSIQRIRRSLEAREEQVRRRLRQVQQKQRARRTDSRERQRLLSIARRLRSRKMPAANRALLEQYIGELDTAAVRITGQTVRDLSALRDWYEDRMANDPDAYADKHIEKMLQRLHKKQISQLTPGEVADLTDVLLSFEHQLLEEHRLIAQQDRRDVYHMMEQTQANIQNSGGDRGAGPLRRLWSQGIVSSTLSPIRMLRRMTGYVDSDPLVQLGNALADGQRAAMDYEMRAGQTFRDFARDKKFSRRFAGRDAEWVSISGWSGTDSTQTVQAEITPAMRVSLYLHSLNPQNLAHIVEGGITIPDAGWYRKGDMAEAYKRGVTVRLTPTAIRQITSGMTAKERAFAQAARSYFNKTSKAAINQVSEQLKGYSIATVDEYFPIQTDRAFTRAEFESVRFDGTIEGMGFLKEREGRASNPILLRDVSDVVDQAVRMHGRYVGLAIPVRNMSKLLSATEKGYTGSVMKSIGQVWGKEGQSWLEKLMGDVQAGKRGTDSFFGRLLRRAGSSYAGAVLELNASVAMKQAASYPTAAAVLGWKPLALAMKDLGRVDLETIGKYTPLQWYRSLGFDGAELRDMGKNRGVRPKALSWIQGVDVLTTRKLWKASEYYVRENRPELARGSEAYYRAAAEIYNRVIEETQPNYAPMQRPQLLRSDDTLLGALSMFKTQPFQNFGILYDAAANLIAKARQTRSGGDRAALDAAWRDFGRAVSSQLVQLGVFAGMTLAWALFRGRTGKYEDEDGELSLESVLAGLGMDMAGGVFAMAPFGSDVWELGSSMVSGERYYGMDAVNVSAISDAADAVIGLYELAGELFRKAAAGEAPQPNRLRLELTDCAGDISKLFGVPAENVLNLTAAAARQVLRRTMGEYLGEYYALRLTADPDKKSAGYYDLLYQAMQHSTQQYEAIYQAMTDSGDFTLEKIRSAMETRMKRDQGVTGVDELERRYLSPQEEEHYERVMAELTDSGLWSRASGAQQEKAEKLLYGLSVGNAAGTAHQERIDDGSAYGLSETDYILFRLALSMADQPNKNGNLGTYTAQEVQTAIEMLEGLSEAERSYLWGVLGMSERSDPWG